MRASRPRALALLFVAILMVPMLPLDQLGPLGSAGAQVAPQPTLAGVLPQDVRWENWQATHQLYLHTPGAVEGAGPPCIGGTPDPNNPGGTQAAVPGDQSCQLAMNTTEPTKSEASVVARATADSGDVPTGEVPAEVPDASTVWTRLQPPLAHAMQVNGLSILAHAEFNPPLRSCEDVAGDTLGLVRADFQVSVVGGGDQPIATLSRRYCPADEHDANLLPSGDVGTIWPLAAELPLTTPSTTIEPGQQVEVRITLFRPLAVSPANTYNLAYNATEAPTHLALRSPDAFQFAVWTENPSLPQGQRVTTIFPVPQFNEAERVSAVGFFAFKSAFGGYDAPAANDSDPRTDDAKWQMQVRAPSGQLVQLQDHQNYPDSGGVHEFQDCDGGSTHLSPCLVQARTSGDTPPSARVFRLPDRPLVPGGGPVWNYTKGIIQSITGGAGGGEFKLEVTGGVRGHTIQTRLPDGFAFTVGGFGVRLEAVRVGDVREELTHVFCTRAANEQCNGTSTTFLLNLTNLGSRQDNYTLAATILTPSAQGWTVGFSGPAVKGASKATLDAFNSSLLKVTLTPPATATPGASVTVRVRATSDSSPDQFAEKDVTAQVSSTVQRGVGLMLFPDAAFKSIRRGQLATFNYTIWNRGSTVDSFEAFCQDGPNPDLDASGRRIDDTWNGTIRLGDQVIGCQDTNRTRRVTTTIQPGDTVEARVLLESNFNNTIASTRTVKVEVTSQGDSQKVDSATATASVERRTSLKVFILTDGLGNPDDPQSQTGASRMLRYGKDDPNACPNPGTTNANLDCGIAPACETGGTGCGQTYTNDWSESGNLADVQNQRVDHEWGEFALYRVTVLNDGDQSEQVYASIGEIRNSTESGCGMRPNSFDAVRGLGDAFTGMSDPNGVRLLRRPILKPDPAEDSGDLIGSIEGTVGEVEPGKTAVFYLRVRSEWNRYNLSQMDSLDEGGGVGSVTAGEVCGSVSRVTVNVFTRHDNPLVSPDVRAAVQATTEAVVRGPSDPDLRKNIVISEGARCGTPNHMINPSPACAADGSRSQLFETQQRVPCPPITSSDSPDRLFCRFVRPGLAHPWYFTVSKFWPIGDEFIVKPIRRVGGLSLADLKNRGWEFGISDPATGNITERTDIPKILEQCSPTQPDRCIPQEGQRAAASGDEMILRIDVRMPANATVNDFAGLEIEAGGKFSGVTKTFSFFTVGAQRFKVSANNLARGDIVIHPGDRAAINLNVSNEGSAVDKYSITLKDPLPGWSATFQPNETRVSPSRNKTVTVFLQSPTQGNFPLTVRGTLRVRSLVNLSEIPGETFVDVPFTVNVDTPPGPQDLRLAVRGGETQNIFPTDPNRRTATFTLNVSNPSPSQKFVALRRLPSVALVPEFVDGWHDTIAEPCFEIAAAASTTQPTNKSVSFTVTGAPDALEGTHVTYVLRADEVASCNNIQDSRNFAQALVTAVVIGQVGIEVQPEAPALVFRPGEARVYSDVSAAGLAVIPRNGYVHFPVRVRNVGTANDTISLQATLLNLSQQLGPSPWRVQMHAQSQASQGCTPVLSAAGTLQAFAVEPGFSCIVLVNVSAPLNIPQLGQHADIDFVARATSPVSQPPGARLTAYVQDYDIRIRVTNTTVDAVPGQTLNFLLNITNGGTGDCPRVLCTGFDTFDIQVDIGGLAGFWNVTTELANPRDCGTNCLALLNGTSKDVQLSVQVPRVRPDSAPTTGAVLGIIVRSRQAEALRPQAENLGAGSPLTQYLITVPKTLLVTVNLYPYVAFDVDDDKELELAVDRNRNNLDGFEFFSDPFTAIIQSVGLLAADGDDDGKVDHFLDKNLDGRPDRYWDPDEVRLTTVHGGDRGNVPYPDVNNDGTLEFLYDADADLAIDHWIDPATRRTGVVIEKDFDDDGSPEFIIDTNGDGRPDRYFDPDRGPRGLVTSVQLASSGGGQRYEIDTNGGGQPTKVYDRVTGEVSNAVVFGALEFVGSYWYLVLLFLAVAVLAGYLVVQRRKARRGGGEGGQP